MATLIIEHKTSSEDVGSGSMWWRRLSLDAQISTYLVGARSLGYSPDGVLYDVLRKPTLQPRMATPLASRKYKKDKTLYANMREHDETPTEYHDRLVEDICARPEHYYQRGVVVRLESEEQEAAMDMWQVAEQIRLSRNDDAWPRNVGSCVQYGRPCDYWPVCSGEGTLDTYERKEGHEELDQKHHLPILSASSVATYRACPRKYYLRYEQGYRRAEKSGALWFGSLVHLGLETWLRSGCNLDAMLAAVVSSNKYEQAKAQAMLRGYHARWAGENLEVLEVEKEFQTPLINPKTGAKSKTFMRGGKMDGIVRTNEIF